MPFGYFKVEREYLWHSMPDWVCEHSAVHCRISLDTDRCGVFTSTDSQSLCNRASCPAEDYQRPKPETPRDDKEACSHHDPSDSNEKKNEQQCQHQLYSQALLDSKRSCTPEKSGRDILDLQPLTSYSNRGTAVHTVRFHGPNWKPVLEKSAKKLECAFRKDVIKATELKKKRIENLQFKCLDMLIAKFTVKHNRDEKEMLRVHSKLQTYGYPHTTALYR